MATSTRDDEYNKAKICDFGLSYLVDPSSRKVRTQVKCGTIGYMAPEI
jgi:serine/threonine protein kinase